MSKLKKVIRQVISDSVELIRKEPDMMNIYYWKIQGVLEVATYAGFTPEEYQELNKFTLRSNILNIKDEQC